MTDNSQYNEWLEYAAESRACGYEVMPFDEWLDPGLVRRRAESRVLEEWQEYYPEYDDWQELGGQGVPPIFFDCATSIKSVYDVRLNRFTMFD